MFGVETVREAAWAIVRVRLLRVLLAAVAVWLGLSFATIARAQISSVRQAKLVTTDANGNPLLNDIAVANSSSGVSSRSFDTTAFGSAIITVTQVSGSCGTDLNITYPTREVPGVYGWVRLEYTYNAGASTLQLSITSATAQSASFNGVFLPQANTIFESVASSCVFDASLTLVPFPSTVVSNGPFLTNSEVTPLSIAPVIIGGISDVAVDGMVTLRAAHVESDGALLVTGTITPVTPTLTTEDPIVPNSVTTSETVYTFDGTKRVTLQNNGTGAALCRVTSNSSLTIDTSSYTFSVAAATSANDGTGAATTLPYVPAASTYLRCAALSGTAILSGYGHP